MVLGSLVKRKGPPLGEEEHLSRKWVVRLLEVHEPPSRQNRAKSVLLPGERCAVSCLLAISFTALLSFQKHLLLSEDCVQTLGIKEREGALPDSGYAG